MITIICFQCGRPLALEEESTAKRILCPDCHSVLDVPPQSRRQSAEIVQQAPGHTARADVEAENEIESSNYLNSPLGIFIVSGTFLLLVVAVMLWFLLPVD